MDPFFMQLAKNKKYKNLHLYVEIQNFFCHWATCDVGPPITQYDFIFVPTCVDGNHWVLFVFAVKRGLFYFIHDMTIHNIWRTNESWYGFLRLFSILRHITFNIIPNI